jgi:hypothetical protein
MAFNATWNRFLTGTATPFGLANTTLTALQLAAPFCSDWTPSGCTASQQSQQIAYWAQVSAW